MAKEYTPYCEKLRDPRWQKKRLEIMERDEFKCRHCEDDTSTLNVHHGFYTKDTEPWDYPDDSMKTLCEGCHKRYKSLNDLLRRIIGRLSLGDLSLLLGNSVRMLTDHEAPDHDYRIKIEEFPQTFSFGYLSVSEESTQAEKILSLAEYIENKKGDVALSDLASFSLLNPENI